MRRRWKKKEGGGRPKSSDANKRKATDGCKGKTRGWGWWWGGSLEVESNVALENIFFCQHFSKAEMEVKRKQEEEDRKKRAEEEKVMQVWKHTSCYIRFPQSFHSLV